MNISRKIDSFMWNLQDRATEYRENKERLKLFLLCSLVGVGIFTVFVPLAFLFVGFFYLLITQIWLQCVVGVGVVWLFGRLILLGGL